MTFTGRLTHRGEALRAGHSEGDTDSCWCRPKAKVGATLAKGGEEWWRRKALVGFPSYLTFPTPDICTLYLCVWELHEFPVAAVANDRQLKSFKPHIHVILQF